LITKFKGFGSGKHARPTLLWTWLTAMSMLFGLGWHQVQTLWANKYA